jgi:hypothetical protein
MGMSGSASFQRVRNSLQAASALTRAASASAPCEVFDCKAFARATPRCAKAPVHQFSVDAGLDHSNHSLSPLPLARIYAIVMVEVVLNRCAWSESALVRNTRTSKTQPIGVRVLGFGLLKDRDVGPSRERAKLRCFGSELRYCGSPTLLINSAKRGSARKGSSKKSVFKNSKP